MFESMDLGTIITLAITLIGTFAGGAWALAKGKLKKVVTLGSEALDIVKALESALEDDKVDKSEVANIKKELDDVKAAWQALVKKE